MHPVGNGSPSRLLGTDRTDFPFAVLPVAPAALRMPVRVLGRTILTARPYDTSLLRYTPQMGAWAL